MPLLPIHEQSTAILSSHRSHPRSLSSGGGGEPASTPSLAARGACSRWPQRDRAHRRSLLPARVKNSHGLPGDAAGGLRSTPATHRGHLVTAGPVPVSLTPLVHFLPLPLELVTRYATRLRLSGKNRFFFPTLA